MESRTLYLELGVPASAGDSGRTVETRAKETVDNDVEALALEILALAPVRSRERTSLTATKETVDNDREASAWLDLLASG
jgi:hypothetical protein